MTAEQAVHSFWSSFGLTAYDENSVPDNAQLPYITYNLSYDAFENEVAMSGSVWFHSTSWTAITAVADSIYNELKHGGKVIKTNAGYIWIKRGSPFYQRVSEEDNVKRIYINISCQYFQE